MIVINVKKDKFLKKVFYSLNFDIEGPVKVKGQSGLNYLISGVAYNKDLDHHVLIFVEPTLVYPEFSLKEILLTVIDSSHNFSKNLSFCVYNPRYVFWIDKSYSYGKMNDSGKFIEYPDDSSNSSIIKEVIQSSNYKNLLDIYQYICPNDETGIYSPVVLLRNAYISLGNRDGSRYSVIGCSREEMIKSFHMLQGFIENWGGFLLDVNVVSTYEIELFLKDTNKDSLKLFLRRLGIKDFFFPSINNYVSYYRMVFPDSSEKEILESIEVLNLSGHKFEGNLDNRVNILLMKEIMRPQLFKKIDIIYKYKDENNELKLQSQQDLTFNTLVRKGRRIIDKCKNWLPILRKWSFDGK
jgi:hypothetical protein